MLLTDGILDEYQKTSDRVPQFQLQPALRDIAIGTNVVRLDEYFLNRFPINLNPIPREHRAYIEDAIGAGAEFLITRNERWLRLSPDSSERYGLYIVTPEHFLDIEG